MTDGKDFTSYYSFFHHSNHEKKEESLLLDIYGQPNIL